MTQILLAFSRYVPVNYIEEKIDINGNLHVQPDTEMSPRLLFGDKLTSAWVRGPTALCCFHNTSLDRLEDFMPATSNWHARLSLVTEVYTSPILNAIYDLVFNRFCTIHFTVLHLKIRAYRFNSKSYKSSFIWENCQA